MRFKRLISAAMAAVLALTLVLPVGAAGKSSFQDVKDEATAVNADILHLMGVVSGTGGSLFNPNGVLSRAEFCTMLVNFMQKSDQVPIHSTRTIFNDVPGNHWARGYINLAASLTLKGGEKEPEIPLVSGVGDGRFQPDSQINQAQAATILVRMLGYTSTQAGSVWPQSHMNLAKSIGLTEGLPTDYYAPLTRAQVAQMFVNALSCKMKDGKEYYTSLGEAKPGVVMLAVNVQAETGDAMGALRTSAGTYLPKVEKVAPTALQGRRGSLVLNTNNEVITFIPDDTVSVTVTLSGDAKPGVIETGYKQYTVAGDTLVYTAEQTEGKPYIESYSTLYSGTQLTLFTQRGKVVAIYANSTTTAASADAVVVMGNATEATFHQLTGGASNFKILKNRQPISMSNIKPYDVVTYDAMSNTLIVSDLRMTCIYQDAVPNVSTPKTIRVLGNEFTVLESAWHTTKDFTLGNAVTLLLTADGKVAGMTGADPQLKSTAVGTVSASGAKVFLPNGGIMELKGAVSDGASLEGQLVTISGGKTNFNAGRLLDSNAPGPFHVERMTLGSYTVMNGVRIFEKVTNGAITPVNLSDLDMESIPADNIAGYHLNSSNMVDYIVLKDVTGNAYKYGILFGYSIDGPDDKPRVAWRLLRGVGGIIDFSTTSGYAGKSGQVVGVSTYKNSKGEEMIRSVVPLEKLKGVTAKDIFESQGDLYVSVNGRNYQIATDVECYSGITDNQTDPNSWFKQSDVHDRVNAMKAYSSNLTIYVDPVGQQVRVITAG